MDEVTVRGIGIRIRDEGHISKSGRGPSAARMTTEDAMALLIGVNACTSAVKAAEAVEKYKGLNRSGIYPSNSKLKGYLRGVMSEKRQFGHVLDALIDLCTPRIGKMDVFAETLCEEVNFDKDIKSILDNGADFDDTIRVEIGFIRPIAGAYVKLVGIASARELLRVEYFETSKKEKVEFDRRDLTTITQLTLRKVGSLV